MNLSNIGRDEKELIIKFFGAQIPFITGYEFWALLVAQIVLVLGCIMRGL